MCCSARAGKKLYKNFPQSSVSGPSLRVVELDSLLRLLELRGLQHKMTFSPQKTTKTSMLLKEATGPCFDDSLRIKYIQVQNYLGVFPDEKLQFKKHQITSQRRPAVPFLVFDERSNTVCGNVTPDIHIGSILTVARIRLRVVFCEVLKMTYGKAHKGEVRRWSRGNRNCHMSFRTGSGCRRLIVRK